MDEPVEQRDLSLAEVEAWAKEQVADLPPPTAEQFRALVSDLLVAACKFALGAPNVIPGWSQGWAFIKIIETQPCLRGRGVTEALRWLLAQHEGADGTPGGLSPLGIFMAKALDQWQRRAAGADLEDVDVAIIIELRKLLNVSGIPLPSNECLYELIGGLDGLPFAYLRRKQGQRPKATHRQLLVGVVAFLVETLIVGKAFGAIEAAAEVAKRLNAAGICQPSGRRRPFTASLVTKWHERVIWHAKRGVEDPELDIYEMQQRVLKRLYPDHMQWDRPRLENWLDEAIRYLARHHRPHPGG